MLEVLMFQIKNLKGLNLLFTFSLFFLSHHCIALSSDAEQNMTLRADKVTFDNKTKKTRYLGHVYLKQGSAKLKANSASSYLNDDNQLEKAIALGSALHKALFETLLDGQKKPLKGTADKITYLPKTQLVRLEGKATLTHGSNTYAAPIIVYDMKHQRLLSHKTKKQRTTIILNEKTS